MILKYLIEKEFKQMARDPFILFIGRETPSSSSSS